MGSIIAYASNWLQQRKLPETKIFFIGFNRCGTNSFHQLLKRSGIRSVHWLTPQKENITDEIVRRLNDHSALQSYLSRWTAFSDMISASNTQFVEGNSFYPTLHDAFPQSYFIFNDRDVEAWIRSRIQHSKGSFLHRATTYHGTDRDGVCDIWRRQHAEHLASALAYFSENPRFIHFRIDRDPIDRIVEFLSPDFKVSAADWQVHKKSGANAYG